MAWFPSAERACLLAGCTCRRFVSRLQSQCTAETHVADDNCTRAVLRTALPARCTSRLESGHMPHRRRPGSCIEIHKWLPGLRAPHPFPTPMSATSIWQRLRMLSEHYGVLLGWGSRVQDFHPCYVRLEVSGCTFARMERPAQDMCVLEQEDSVSTTNLNIVGLA